MDFNWNCTGSLGKASFRKVFLLLTLQCLWWMNNANIIHFKKTFVLPVCPSLNFHDISSFLVHYLTLYQILSRNILPKCIWLGEMECDHTNHILVAKPTHKRMILTSRAIHSIHTCLYSGNNRAVTGKRPWRTCHINLSFLHQ